MPGTRLSQAEKDLIGRWKNGNIYKLPRLSQISLSGGSGIRGIRDLVINIDRPITVIIGESGVGKSTILSLCRLGFQNNGSQRTVVDNVNEDFEKLFIFADTEQPFKDFEIIWSYLGEQLQPIRFEGKLRSLTSNRPTKPVLYIGLSRVVPSHEIPTMVGHFQSKPSFDQIMPLSNDYKQRLSNILRKPYTEAVSKYSSGFELRTCSRGDSYTSFNMSTAEDTLIQMFQLIQATPDESLVIIDNIETGLFPAALFRLAQNLIDICFRKKLQVIITTSSVDFVDAVPEIFRCLVENMGNKRVITENVATSRVVSSISSYVQPDVIVFCEDPLVENLIRYAVPGDLRRRLKIVNGGSKNRLAQFAEIHIKSGWEQKLLIVWDGDVTLNEINGWMGSLDLKDEEKAKINRIRLPGGQPPERWIVEQLSNAEGYELLAEQLREDESHAELFLTMLNTLLEHHNVFRELAHATQLKEEDAAIALTRAIAKLSNHPLDELAKQIESVANGQFLTV